MKKLSASAEVWLMERAKQIFGATNPSDRLISLSLAELPVSALRWPVHALIEARLEKASLLVRDYLGKNINPFGAAFSDNKISIPVFVVSDQGSFVIVDGAHRAFAALPFVDSLHGWLWDVADKYPPFPYETFSPEQLLVRNSVAIWQERFLWKDDASAFVNFTKVTDALSREILP